MGREVFICHSSADARIAAEICARLEESGVQCWIAPRDPLAGIPYGQQIANAIAASRLVLLVFSARANDSRPVLNELELASSHGKIVLPVRLDGAEPAPGLEFYVRPIHWFDASNRPIAEVYEALVQHVQHLLAPSLVPTVSDRMTTRFSNIPTQLTSFVGRERDVEAIKSLLRANRLVTVVGSGGCGKTRVATQVGVELLDEFDDGVSLVELAPIANGALVVPTIARSLDVRESADRPLMETLLAHLRRRRLLLIVDNCEHLIDDVRDAVRDILRSCLGVRALATSLESLSIAGERIFRLPSLAIPSPGEAVTAETAPCFGALRLFADRALAADGRFAVSDDNAASVSEICRRLDGIPLAIELAAARIKVLSPRQLAKMLDERFRVLTGGDRRALPRHQTMRALIDWSYELLSNDESELFRRLSVFSGGFTFEGASAVGGNPVKPDDIAILDLLSGLVDKSLVQVEPGSATRYRMLESTRQYAREKLEDRSESETSRNRHLAYVRELFNAAGDEYERTMLGSSVTRLATELEDARSALAWAVSRSDGAAAADLFLATRLWDHLGLHREATEWAMKLLSLVDPNDTSRLAKLWARVALLAGRTGHFADASDAAARCMGFARRSRDRAILADCLLCSADALGHARRFNEAFAAVDEAERAGSSTFRQTVQALHLRGLIALISGDLDIAANAGAQVRDLYASVGNDMGTVSASLNLAEREHARGATRRAIEIATAELARAEALSDRSTWAQLMRNLAGYFAATGDVAAARRAATDAIAYYGAHDREGALTAALLEHLALCAATEGDAETAALLEGYADKTIRQLGFEREYTESTSRRLLLERLEKDLQAGLLGDMLARGESMDAQQALNHAARYFVT